MMVIIIIDDGCCHLAVPCRTQPLYVTVFLPELNSTSHALSTLSRQTEHNTALYGADEDEVRW
ncbi:hypothetical protein EDWATA_01791 [Edwardsiella tarda ATCC 23685]|uniref:Uncharacterized protein n=1 Tax=Edwardsiella tarda ATCC 23685 TaxID=500638 RepID=D4F4W4_EDWTA|nr:hypothetical protein EDWATA_01791 [Edwardsiella tarda ATCC 23685]